MTDSTYRIDRAELMRVFNPRAAKAFEAMQDTVAAQGEVTTANVEATSALSDAAFVTLSGNAELPNEYVLQAGSGIALDVQPGKVTIQATGPKLTGGYGATFITPGTATLILPVFGTLATTANQETFEQKTLAAPKLSGIVNAVDDAAAAAAGVPVGGVYRNGSAVMVRVA